MRIPDRRFALYLMTPAALFLAVFVAYPLFRLVTDSFFKISPIVGGPVTSWAWTTTSGPSPQRPSSVQDGGPSPTP
ncbi:binding-Protein-Dependent transport systems inner membrane component [Arthrobacter sp. Hiyo8]|nr:binding-Protein-Dependent transport systems inner membrane component [Arthrobacter sp. Hiyo8]